MATIDEIMNYEGGIGESGTANYEPGYSEDYDYGRYGATYTGESYMPRGLSNYSYASDDYSKYGSIMDADIARETRQPNMPTSTYQGSAGLSPTGSMSTSRITYGQKPMPYFSGMTDWRGNPITPGTRGYWQMPDKPTLPTYTAPSRNEERIKELTQKAGAAGATKLSRGLESALTKAQTSSNPYIARMGMREALRGYGEGLDTLMSGAQQTGLAQYEREYQPLVEQAKLDYQTKLRDYRADIDRANMAYQTALRDYFGSQR